MSHPTVYLVTGANRGLGLGLVKELAQRENVHIYAGTRNLDSSSELQSVAKKYQDKVTVIKIVSADRANNQAAIEEIEKKVGRLDVIIANAAIANAYGPAAETKPEDLLEHYQINAIGPLILFQVAWPLLMRSNPNPKFVPIGTINGSISVGAAMPIKAISYGASKAALHYITRKLYNENEGLIAFPVCPGPVATDMANYGFKNDPAMAELGSGVKMQTNAEAAAGVLKWIDGATRENIDNVFPTLMPGIVDGKAPW